MSETFHCPNCGAPLDYIHKGDLLIQCPFCRSSVIVPEALRSIAAGQEQKRVNPSTPGADSLVEQTDQFVELVGYLQSGKKIQAIKQYRQITGLGLKEAKDAVEALEAGQPVVLIASKTATQASGRTFSSADFDRAVLLAEEGKLMEASQLLQLSYQLEPPDAQALVEQIQSGAPDLARQRLMSHSRFLSQDSGAIQVNSGVLGKIAAAIGTGIGCSTLFFTLLIVVGTMIPIVVALSQSGGPLNEPLSRLNPFGPNRLQLSFGQEGTGPGHLADPRFISLDGAGYIYVADYETGRIQRFSPSGDYQSQWKIESEPYINALFTQGDGEVFVVHSGMIFKYDGATGRYLGQVTLPAEENVYVEDLVIAADGSLVMIDSDEDLLRLDPAGQVNLTIPDAVSAVSGDSELDTRVAVDGLGNMFLLGTFNDAVFKYSASGAYLTRFGGSGDGPGQFRAAGAIRVDSQGRVYVSDSKGIQVFDNDGRFLRLLKVQGYAFGLALDQNDHLFIVTNTPRVYQYSPLAP